MMRRIVVLSVRILYSLLLAVGTPLAAAFFLNAEGPLAEVLIFAGCLSCLFLLKDLLPGKPGKAAAAALIVFYVLFSFFILLYIIVIPYPSYLAWIDLVKSHRPGGIISFLFFMGTVYFSGLFGGLVHRSGYVKPLGGLLVVVCFELAVIYQNLLTLLLFTCALALALLFFSFVPRRFNLKFMARPLLILLVIIGVGLPLALASPPNSGYLVNRTLDPGIKRFILEFFPDLPLLTTVAGYGHFYESKDIGNRPLLSNTPIFLVHGPSGKGLYIRTQIYDEYSEDNWSLSFNMRNKIRALTTTILTRRQERTQKVSLDLLFDFFDLLPHTLDTVGVEIENQPDTRIVFGTRDTGYFLNPPLLKGDHLLLYISPRDTGGLDMAPEAMEYLTGLMGRELTVQNTDISEDQKDLLPYYLEVPGSISPRIKTLAHTLGVNSGTPWQLLRNIRRYLSRDFIYTLNTSPPPKGTTFLDDFLFESKKGFCVHFATAFVILARLNGIPARYASGFFVYIPQAKNKALVTGMHAHVWPEVWFPGIGWVTLEATPAVNPNTLYGPEYYRLFNQENDALTARQLEALMGQKIPVPSRQAPEIMGNLLFLLPFLAAAALVFFVVFGAHLLIRRFPRHRSLYRGSLRVVDRRLRRLVTLLKKRDIPDPARVGWVGWGRTVAGCYPQTKHLVRRLVTGLQAIFYNSREPEKRYIVFICLLERRLRRL
jgi:transglutaminase-like putative cysteine protease